MALQRIEIIEATTRQSLAAVRELFVEYSHYPNIDICLADFDADMAAFPHGYAALLLALVDGRAAGAVGLKALDENSCEMKRLYARAPFRGMALGRMLCERLIKAARQRGFKSMRLETLTHLKNAIAIYEALGFSRINHICQDSSDELVYMERALSPD